MSPYTERLFAEGIYKQEKFVLDHPDGCGVITISTEQIENLIAMTKKFSICKNTGKQDCFKQIAKFLSLYCMGSIITDQIDFSKILKQLKHQKLLIYDPIKTPQLFQQLENEMPNVMLKMVQLIERMNVGDPLPPIIKRIYDHGDIGTDEINQAESNAFGDDLDGFVNDVFYINNQ